jgi:hypothetical protein
LKVVVMVFQPTITRSINPSDESITIPKDAASLQILVPVVQTVWY